MGTVVVSLDAELAWGYHDLDPFPSEKFRWARDSWLWLLDALENYEVPATWAIVGHLFLEECNGVHEDHAAPPGWFQRDPGGKAGDHPHWFGPELIEAVLDSPVDHEVASHSFSHLEFGAETTSREMARAEVAAAVDAAHDWGIDLESFVFPRNEVDHLGVLADMGFRNYRAPAGRRLTREPIAGVAKLVDYGVGLTAPTPSRPTIGDHGLVRHPASQYLFAFEKSPRAVLSPVQSEPVVSRVRKGLERVARHGGILHLWFHPNELRSDDDRTRVGKVLAAIDRKRRRGNVEVETMSSVGRRVRSGLRT